MASSNIPYDDKGDKYERNDVKRSSTYRRLPSNSSSERQDMMTTYMNRPVPKSSRSDSINVMTTYMNRPVPKSSRSDRINVMTSYMNRPVPKSSRSDSIDVMTSDMNRPVPKSSRSDSIDGMTSYMNVSHSDSIDGGTQHRIPFDIDEDMKIRMVIIGRTGSGKSSTGNTIMQTEYFKSDVSSSSITKSCKEGILERKERNNKKAIHLVDTPGLFDTELSNEKVKLEILKCFAILAPGPHVIIYVLRTARYTEEEMKSVDHFLHVFGGNPYKYTTIVFTGSDALKLQNMTSEEYLKKMPNSFHSLLEKCGKRVVFLNNVSEVKKDIQRQHENLFVVIDKMLEKNTNSFYSNEILEELKGDILKAILDNMDNYQPGRMLFKFMKIAGYCMIFVGTGFLIYGFQLISLLLFGLGGVLVITKTETIAETKVSEMVKRLRKQTSPCCIL
ncbi:uncharacterized protein LOC143052621 isoform X2 [Mytilus galloprovincialis]|uniref:uncharacterized protein LOC143052621 isoform X2 n=1 Tax=Mytilus galloprovincialis TaxID=29158 RepID=UPI003F7C81B2